MQSKISMIKLSPMRTEGKLIKIFLLVKVSTYMYMVVLA